MRNTLLAGCLLGLMTIPLSGQAAPGNARGDEMVAARCGDILDLFAAANPEGAKDRKALLAAQDRTYAFVMWVHGYLSGRDGIDFAKRPLSQAGVTAMVKEIYQVCANDEKRIFLDAVKEVR